MKRRIGVLGAAGLLGVCTIHCGGSSGASGEEGQDGREDVATTSEAITTYPYCWAQIERPLPSDATLPIGTQMELRTNPTLICPPGVSNTLVYRFYVEGPSGRLSAEATNVWSTTRIVPFDTSSLTPGLYKIYVYSLPASLLSAWLAGDPTARAATHRSGNTYTTFVDATWTMGAWSACSLACDGGTQTRTATCVDQNGVVRDGMCKETPITTQSCNEQACAPDTLSVAGTSSTFTPQTQTVSNGFYVWADPTPSGWSVDVEFPAQPTSAQDYAAFDDSKTWPIPAGNATVWIWNSTTTYWTTSASPAIHVVSESDGHLHVVYSDPALPDHSGGSTPVAFDLTLPN